MQPHAPDISIIVPTYREADNLRPLVDQIAAAMTVVRDAYELIIVDDDSRDGTEVIARELGRLHPLRLIVRTQYRDLSQAVLDGLREAQGKFLVVMDADLSHPADQIGELIAPLREGRADFVIGSRYVAGASTHNWAGHRRLNSYVATLLARPLSRGVRDTMAGFFALPRDVFEQARNLQPIGYKIGLELLCRTGCRRPMEIPIRFQDRALGTSKLNLEQQARYLIHLNRLYGDYRRGWGLLVRPAIALMLICIRIAQRVSP
jgi:dolichol-phosphate mannosyltransferase